MEKSSTERLLTTFEKVRGVVVEQLGVEPEEVTPNISFVDLGADSLDTQELILAFEELFECEVSREDERTLLTVQDVVNYADSHR
jgi:acyl carrier protein